jgi:hypothetical protein
MKRHLQNTANQRQRSVHIRMKNFPLTICQLNVHDLAPIPTPEPHLKGVRLTWIYLKARIRIRHDGFHFAAIQISGELTIPRVPDPSVLVSDR